MARTSANQKLGKRLKQLRVEAGLTQEKLGIASGISQAYISGVEKGTRNPSFKTLDKLAKAIGVTVNELTDFQSYKAKDHSRIWRHN